jgi:hypothetical protein
MGTGGFDYCDLDEILHPNQIQVATDVFRCRGTYFSFCVLQKVAKAAKPI